MNHWDTHGDNFTTLKNTLLPPSDRGVSALLEDLDARGLLDDDPRWSSPASSAAPRGSARRPPSPTPPARRPRPLGRRLHRAGLAAAASRPGLVLGASDRIGAYPASAGYTPADLAATIYRRSASTPPPEIRDMFGRPFRLNGGTPIAPLLA